jgi:methylmalonyl-CoA mutase cobalamin-binding domain/chain
VETKKENQIVRVLIAKIGEVSSRGTDAIDSEMREAGIEVIYTKNDDLPDAIAKSIVQSKVDVIYFSSLLGTNVPFIKKLLKELEALNASEIPVLLGNTNTESNNDHLRTLGVSGIFPSATKPMEIIRYIHSIVKMNSWVPEVAGSLTGKSLDELHLLGSKCHQCGQVYFPSRRNCPHCFDEKLLSQVQLADIGILRSFVLASVAPPGYGIPHAQGYIELCDDGPLIFSLLTDYGDESNLKIGGEMVIKIVKKGRGKDHRVIAGYRFRPLKKEK